MAAAEEKTVGHRALGLCVSNWKDPRVFVLPSEFNPECVWNSLANFKLDELLSRRKPAPEKTQALSQWLHKGSKGSSTGVYVCTSLGYVLSLATGQTCKHEQQQPHPSDWDGDTCTWLGFNSREGGIPRSWSLLDAVAFLTSLTKCITNIQIKFISNFPLNTDK